MANDKVAIWNQTPKLARSPANGELLIGNGDGFNLSALTAGSGVTISNASGAVTINATGTGGTVTSVTATAPLASSGGTAPDISLGTVGADKGGTGQTSLTLNNVILGNGTGAVQFVAPGTSGNVLTSNGTTWASVAPAVTWTLLKKTSDFSLTSTTTFTDVTGLTFPMAANKTYDVKAVLSVNVGAGGYQVAINGPAIGTGNLRVLAGGLTGNLTAISTYATAFTTISSAVITLMEFRAIIHNGANAGTFAVQFKQNSSSTVASIIETGSWLEYLEV